jgi:diguanylate cyclase (GGDEF)-like protein
VEGQLEQAHEAAGAGDWNGAKELRSDAESAIKAIRKLYPDANVQDAERFLSQFPAPEGEAPTARGEDRRVETVPVQEERRAGDDRRARIAAENGLPLEHPAVEKLAHHEELAEKDPLTGLMSKPAWDARREANPHHAVLAADIANFKATNDRYGHGNADLVIKALADGLGEIAGRDRSARPHGDELLADFDTIEEARAAADRLQAHAGGLQIEVEMPDGTRETISGVRVHTGTGVKRGNPPRRKGRRLRPQRTRRSRAARTYG